MNQFNTSNWTGRVPRTTTEAFGLHHRRREYIQGHRPSLRSQLLGFVLSALIVGGLVVLAFFQATS